jgi:hypothetical protein
VFGFSYREAERERPQVYLGVGQPHPTTDVHFSLDGGKYDFPKYSGENGKLAKKLGVTGKYSPSVTKEITYKGIPKGKHTIKVELANNDHSPAGATASSSFTVK